MRTELLYLIYVGFKAYRSSLSVYRPLLKLRNTQLFYSSNWQSGAIKLSKQLLITYLVGFFAFSGIAGLFLFNPFGTKSAEAAWFNDNWAYRKEVPITANAAADTDAFFSFSLDTATLITAGQLQSSCQDIRVTDASGNILPYHVGRTNACNNAATTIDALAPNAPNSSTPTLPAGASTFYVYYGNPSVSSNDQGAFSQSEAVSYTVGSIGSEEKGLAPLAYWKFDDASGTNANDATVNNYDGTVSGATWRTEDLCISGKCLSFDGTDDAVDAGDINALDGINKMTVSLWFKQNGLVVNKGLVAKSDYQTQDSWALQTDNSNSDELRVFVFNNISSDDGQNWISTTDANLVSGTWYHVVMVYDGTLSNASRIKFYINGQERATTVGGTIPTSLTSATSTVKIGKFGGSLDRYWNGSIDEVKIYTQALTAAQAAANYNSRQNPDGVAARLGSNAQNMQGALSSGLIGYWKLDETATPSLDSSGSGGSGTWNGNTAAVTGKFGNAGTFDGTGDYVNVPNATATELSAAVTMSAWIKTSTSGGTIISKVWGQVGANYPGYSIGLGSGAHGSGNCSSGIAGIWIGGGTNIWVCGSTSLIDGAWHHVVGTYDGTTANIYVDTVLEGSGARTNGVNINVDTTIGDAFTGEIDEARIYHRALNNSEVTQLNKWAAGPVGYWNLDEQTGQVIKDLSGNGLSGTLGADSSVSTDDPAWQNGKFGGSLYFDGSSDHANIPDPVSGILDITTPITISAWIKYTSGDYRSIVSKGATSCSTNCPYDFYIDNSGYLTFVRAGATFFYGIRSTATVPANQWVHVTATADGTFHRLFINGVESAGALATGSAGTYQVPVANASDVRIGRRADAVPEMLGNIDELKIYNYPRSRSQILEDMNGGHPAPGSPVGTPFLHLQFDEGADNTCSGGTNDVCNSGSGGSSLDGASTASRTNSAKFNKALDFDGFDDNVTITNQEAVDLNVNLASGFTVSAWINPDDGGDTGGNGTIFFKDNTTDSFLQVSNLTGSTVDLSGQLDLATSDATLSLSTAVTVGTWTHVAMTYSDDSDDEIEIYVNGVLKGTSTNGSGAPGTDTANFLIGGMSTFNYDGKIDDFKIYNFALNSEQIKMDMNRGASQVLGALGASSNTQPNSAANEYCPPDSSATVCTGPVVEYKFDEKTGTTTTADTSGNGLPMYFASSPANASWANGKYGGGLYFDGVDDGSDTTPGTPTLDLTGTSAITVDFWLNWVAFSNNDDLAMEFSSNFNNVNTGFVINPNASTGNFHVGMKCDASAPNYNNAEFTRPSAGVWHHYAVVFDKTQSAADEIKVYVDGAAQSTTKPISMECSNAFGNDDLFLMYRGTGSLFGNGTIDQVRIFNYARTPAQVAWGYNKGAPIAHWDMDECQGTVINDRSGNSLTGTLTNATAGTCTTSGSWFNGVAGKRNYSLDFDGSDDNIAVSDNDKISLDSGLAQGFTFAAWVYPNSDGETDVGEIFDKGTNTFCRTNSESGSKVTITCRVDLTTDADFSATTTIPINQWSHVAFSWTNDGDDEVTIWINGIPQTSSAAFAGDGAADANDLTIGGTPNYDGQIDDFKIFNYELTSTQIKSLINDGAARYGPATGAP